MCIIPCPSGGQRPKGGEYREHLRGDVHHQPRRGGRSPHPVGRALSSIVTAGGGTVEKVDDWGKRKLAYPIQDLNDGHYILMHFSANPELPYELERNMKINENIMRYLVIRKDA